MELYISNCK